MSCEMSHDPGSGRNPPYCNSKPMVDHNQQGVKTIGKGKVSDRVTGDLLEWMRAGGRNRQKRGFGGMRVDFVLLAGSASLHIAADIGSQTRPPEFHGD